MEKRSKDEIMQDMLNMCAHFVYRKIKAETLLTDHERIAGEVKKMQARVKERILNHCASKVRNL